MLAGMFEKASCPLGATAWSVKRALKLGSSHIGANRRASGASNCVASIRDFDPSLLV